MGGRKFVLSASLRVRKRSKIKVLPGLRDGQRRRGVFHVKNNGGVTKKMVSIFKIFKMLFEVNRSELPTPVGVNM